MGKQKALRKKALRKGANEFMKPLALNIRNPNIYSVNPNIFPFEVSDENLLGFLPVKDILAPIGLAFTPAYDTPAFGPAYVELAFTPAFGPASGTPAFGSASAFDSASVDSDTPASVELGTPASVAIASEKNLLYSSLEYNEIIKKVECGEITKSVYIKIRSLQWKKNDKMNRRRFVRRIRYPCRKEFADVRPREGGRFVSKSITPVPVSSTS